MIGARRKASGPWWVLVAACLSPACGDSENAPDDPLPHVILISLDTVRADRLGCYGAERASTPHIDAFSADGDRYASCTAASSWTLPTHASLFTGLYPFEHGTHGFRVDGMIDNVHPLHPDHATLAEELAVVGYDTAGFVANTVYLAMRYGIGQGFSTYEVKRQPARAVTSRVLEYLDERASAPHGRPLFLFVNYMDAHRPYAAYSPEETLRLPEGKNPALRLEALCLRVMNENEPPGALGEEVEGLYDRALTNLDAEVGRLLQGLRERGLYDGSTIILTSDHGEAFGEHGIVEHAKDVFEPLVHVPLIVKQPGQGRDGGRGRVLGALASSVDVPGIVAASIPGAAGDQLRSRFARVPGTHPVTSEIHFARPRDIVLYADRFQHERTSIRDGRFKLIVGGEAPELYDVEADPREAHDLATTDPTRVQAMQAALDGFLKAGAYAGERLMPTPPSTAQKRDIKELGYGGADGDDPGVDRPEGRDTAK